VKTRRSLYTALSPFVAPTVCTLHLDVVRKARTQRIPHSESASASASGGAPSALSDGGDGADADTATSAAAAPVDDGVDGGEDAPVRLTLESYPEISQLPLEFQVCVSALAVNPISELCGREVA
jgi:hypothetical protein